MAWQLWPFKRLRRPRLADVESFADEGSVGPLTANEIAWFDHFLAKHRRELCQALDTAAVPGPQVTPGDQRLPDFGWPYHATRIIGEGATGQVFMASDLEFSRTVAIKVSHVGRGEEEAQVFQRLLTREQRHVGQLEHECMVRVYRAGHLADGRVWYAMEHVDGKPLTEFVRSHGLNRRRAISLTIQVAEAVGELHKLCIMHADLKPAHILVTARDQTKVIDFGLARVVGTIRDSEPAVSSAPGHNSCIGGGTPGYRAPELAAGQLGDVRSDVYSLGVVIHELMTGHVPEQSHEIPRDGAQGSPADKSNSRAGRSRYPAGLKAVVDRCIADNPDDRYPNAAALAEELKRWLEDRPVSALVSRLSPGRARAYRTAKLASRHRKAIAFLGLFACLVAAALGVALKMSASADRDQMLIARERQQVTDEKRRADAEHERGETQQHRVAMATMQEMLAQRRIDDAGRALARVPFGRRGIECDVVTQLLLQHPAPTQTVGAHDWGVTAILGSARYIVSAGHDGRLIVWDLLKGNSLVLSAGRWSEPLRRYLRPYEKAANREDSTAIVVGLAWLERERSLVSVSLDGSAVVWTVGDTEGRQLLHHAHPLLSVAASPDEREVACGDDVGTLIVCDEHGLQTSSTLLEGGAVTALAAAGQGRWWVGHERGVVRLVDSQGHSLAEKTVQGPIWQLATSDRGESVAVACERRAIPVLSVESGNSALQESAVMTVPPAERRSPRAVHAVQYSLDGNHLWAVDDLGRLTSFAVPHGSVEFVRDDQGVYQLTAAEIEKWPVPLRRRSAGIALADGNHAIVTAGGDTLIKLWRLNSEPWSRELKVGNNPRVAFDSMRSEFLWIGDRAGKLMLVDADSGNICGAVMATQEPVTAIAVASRDNLVATASGKSVRFWREDNGHIEQRFKLITSEGDIDALALNPDGSRLTIQIRNGKLELWDIPTGNRMASREFRQFQGGRLAFNATADRLAVLDGTTTLILSTQDLQTTSRVPMAVGQGTALTWHPHKSEMLFVGDAVGRVTSRPEMDPTTQPEDWTGGTTIVDLAITPDGKRLLAATSAGRMVVIDHERLGALFAFDIPGMAAASPTISMVLSQTGRFIAISREDGIVSVLRLAGAELLNPTVTRQWSERVCCAGGDASNVRVHPSSVDMDERGYLHAVYLQSDADPDTAKRSWQLVLGRETSSGWERLTLQDYGALPPRGVDALARSHALHIDRDRWFAVAKCDVDATRERAILPHLITGTIGADHDAIIERTSLPIEPQSGFDPFIAVDDRNTCTVVHFSHAGHYLLRSTRDADHWTTARLGRQGDGFRFHAVADAKRMHILFRPTRFNGDSSLPVVLDVPLNDHDMQPSEHRGHFSENARTTPLGLALAASGEPVALYRTGGPDGPSRLLLARRHGDRWTHQIVFEHGPLTLAVSNLASCRDGTIAFAIASQSDGIVWLATVKETSVTVERVWQDPKFPIESHAGQIDCALKFTTGGIPVVLVARSAPQAGYIRTFHPLLSAENSPARRP